MAFISENINKQQTLAEGRRSVRVKRPILMKSPTQTNKGRMSLSPPATIPRGPNLHTTIRSGRKSVTSNYSSGLS